MRGTDPKIFIIIPAFNESQKIKEVVESLLRENYRDVIIVDDGSTNPLMTNLDGLPITYLRHTVNLGQGAALQTGFNYAKLMNADIVVTFDADGQHHVKDLPALLQPILDDDADITFGSRFLLPQKGIPIFKRMVLQQARFINFIFSGLLLSDAHNGLRALNKTALQKINITENRMAHASEILFEVKRFKLRFREIGVHVTYSKYSQQKGQSGWDSIKVLFDLVLHKFFK